MSLNKPTWSSARSICIVKTLAKPGYYPTRKAEKEAWFLSSLRSETQASFNVSLKKNLWYDFGTGKGGNVIDMVMLLERCSFQDALDFLSGNSISFSFCPEIPGKKKTDECCDWNYPDASNYYNYNNNKKYKNILTLLSIASLGHWNRDFRKGKNKKNSLTYPTRSPLGKIGKHKKGTYHPTKPAKTALGKKVTKIFNYELK